MVQTQAQYQCCICGERIDSAETETCSLIVVANWQSPPETQTQQQLYCHGQCLERVVHPSVPLYVLDLES